MFNTFVNLSALLLLVCATLAIAAPLNTPAPTITPAPSVPEPIATICANVGSIINCVNPILSVGPDGIAVGGIGYHNIPGVLSEHGNGALTVGTGGVGVVLTQTFSVLVSSCISNYHSYVWSVSSGGCSGVIFFGYSSLFILMS